jgi:hypothetical protein
MAARDLSHELIAILRQRPAGLPTAELAARVRARPQSVRLVLADDPRFLLSGALAGRKHNAKVWVLAGEVVSRTEELVPARPAASAADGSPGDVAGRSEAVGASVAVRATLEELLAWRERARLSATDARPSVDPAEAARIADRVVAAYRDAGGESWHWELVRRYALGQITEPDDEGPLTEAARRLVAGRLHPAYLGREARLIR